MRTTVSIDDDVLRGARQIAESRGQTLGEALSSLARESLTRASPGGGVRNGIVLLPTSDAETRAGLEEVNSLRDESPA